MFIFLLVFLVPSRAHHPDDQVWRPLGVGVCDGNHGPRQPLCLQHPQHRRGPEQRPWGANPGRAGHHRNSPQPFSGHFRLHLHVCHLSSPTLREGKGGICCPPSNIPTPSFSSIYGLRRFLKVWAIRKSELQADSSFAHLHMHLRSVLKETLIMDWTRYRHSWKIYAHRRGDEDEAFL